MRLPNIPSPKRHLVSVETDFAHHLTRVKNIFPPTDDIGVLSLSVCVGGRWRVVCCQRCAGS